MTALGKLFRLPRSDQRLLATAAVLLPAIKIGLALLPYRRLRALVGRLAPGAPGRERGPSVSPERIAWAVMRVSHAMSGTTCLTRALAAKVLLERSGYPAQVRVGFGRSEDARLVAHAWVESDGPIVLGGSDLTRYTPLLGLEAIRWRAVEPEADR